MMLKSYMLVIFKPGESYRSMTNSPPLQRVLELRRKYNSITDVEVYKLSGVTKDYEYVCTIKFDRGLLLHG